MEKTVLWKKGDGQLPAGVQGRQLTIIIAAKAD
jgi:hypothetical protein